MSIRLKTNMSENSLIIFFYSIRSFYQNHKMHIFFKIKLYLQLNRHSLHAHLLTITQLNFVTSASTLSNRTEYPELYIKKITFLLTL
jgi:hypothetical protein